MKNPKASILVIDDEPDLRLLYELTLLREGYEVTVAESVAQAQGYIRAHGYDVVLTDMRLPDGLGMQILKELQHAGRSERCIVVTAYGSAENAVEALRAGAFDYLTKPVELKQLRTVVASATQQSALTSADVREANTTNPPVESSQLLDASMGYGDLGQAALAKLVGSSDVMQRVKERILKVAKSMAPVHIHGESGTGKELVARALHTNSQRSEGPLVAVNCGAIPENLLEAEFFGACKGAYTGATQDRQGFFQAAKDGTLFLDEIGDLPLAMQTKLLRAIQERRVRPLGATQEEPVNVRLVSATHKNLAEEVAAGRFRQDLYYRLNVIEIHVPTLRERISDLPMLVEALLARLIQDAGLAPMQVAPAFLQELAQQAFPGNVRELENLLHRAVALSDGDVLDASALVFETGSTSGEASGNFESPEQPSEFATESQKAQASPSQPTQNKATDLKTWLDQREKDYLSQILQACDCDVNATAQQLGITLRQLQYRLQRLGLEDFSAEREARL